MQQQALAMSRIYRKPVQEDKKLITIRLGERGGLVGEPILLYGIGEDSWALFRILTSIRMCRLEDVTESEWSDDGFESWDALYQALRGFYPMITKRNIVTVARWAPK